MNISSVLYACSKDCVEGDQFITIDNSYRIYYKEWVTGFECVVIEHSGGVCGEDYKVGDSIWALEDIEVDIILSMIATFDGARHLYFNDYIYYPNIKALSSILTTIRQLEVAYCDDCMWK